MAPTLDAYWIALSQIKGLKAGDKRQLVEAGCPEQVCRNSDGALRELNLSQAVRRQIQSGISLESAHKIQRQCQEKCVEVLTPANSRYPRLLQQIYDPPLVLFSAGQAELLNRPSVGIVGSRRASAYGKRVADELAFQLGSRGLVIVSGLARGADSAAHSGALRAGGDTVAVLGNGLDIRYPPENEDLYRSIQGRGCLLSEWPLGTPPRAGHFPKRNRLISGLSLGVVVTEATRRSGSLITIHQALTQDREAWAVPGNIYSPLSAGTNHLIQEGAYPVLGAEDVLQTLSLGILESQVENRLGSKNSSDAVARILQLLEANASLDIEDLLEQSGISFAELSRILLSLEMDGRIESLPGGQLARKLF